MVSSTLELQEQDISLSILELPSNEVNVCNEKLTLKWCKRLH